jgi:hypothetical protein
VSDPEVVRIRVRRRTRRHRRHRLIRRCLLAAVFVLGGLTGAALLPFDWGSFLASSFSSRPPAQWTESDTRRDLAFSAAITADANAPSRESRPVYPYSIVPGGVHDPRELERVFEKDPVVAAHYREFDFRRARVIQLTQDRTVYVSYRIGGHVYWTTKRVLLRRGEKVITDGKTTLRTRCGNQVSDTARNEVSPSEPAIARMEQPIKIDPGTAAVVPYPTDFESSLALPTVPAFAPIPPPYGLISNFGGSLSLYPPPLPVCSPKKKGGTPGKKGNGVDCTNPPGEVPEPGTLALLSTGLAGAYLRYRRKHA